MISGGVGVLKGRIGNVQFLSFSSLPPQPIAGPPSSRPLKSSLAPRPTSTPPPACILFQIGRRDKSSRRSKIMFPIVHESAYKWRHTHTKAHKRAVRFMICALGGSFPFSFIYPHFVLLLSLLSSSSPSSFPFSMEFLPP